MVVLAAADISSLEETKGGVELGLGCFSGVHGVIFSRINPVIAGRSNATKHSYAGANKGSAGKACCTLGHLHQGKHSASRLEDRKCSLAC